MQAVALPAGVGVRCIDPCLSREHMHQTWASLHATRRGMIDECFQGPQLRGSHIALDWWLSVMSPVASGSG